jgi:vacuolar protein-sorting-associated protein 4
MRGLLYQSSKATQRKNGNQSYYNTFNITSKDGMIPEKSKAKINKKIQQGLSALFSNTIGLQSVLRADNLHFIDRTFLTETTDEKQNAISDSKSSQSETNSLKTHISDASNGGNSKKSNSDATTSTSVCDDNLTQKYYKELRGSLKNCILIKKPPVTFNDIAGNNYAKKIIHEAFVLPNLVPGFFTGKPKPWNKILLYGPPGVGKTMLAQAVCNEVNATAFWVSLADVTSKFIGESEKLLRMLFEMAREHSPAIIVIDEMDSIGRKRNGSESETERRIKTEFLRQMDGINSGADKVYVLATTNMPWELDIAALRRFERRILLPIPDIQAREEIIRLHMGENHTLTAEDFKTLAQQTEGYSGSDLSTVVNEALMRPVRVLQQSTFYTVMKKKKPTPKIMNFDKIIVDNFDVADSEEAEEFYQPCDENEPGAVKKSLAEIPPNQLLLRDVNLKDFKESVKNCKPTVHHSFIELYNKFLLKYGHSEQKGDIPKAIHEPKPYFL